ncbi:PilZ domain-containing protein [Sphingomonas sp. JC676]|uniref:PilZ domain-containing protein n=1 Tax=Sphingomonas sp. JC676 TaxID=2768065 RepID=UPI00165869D7|nr:PilZ domain-containing protein [Sphingomonas sp. JC676]MBC9032348.1 PilZ domain-containing protein [Sphingomonas sp. JC676]
MSALRPRASRKNLLLGATIEAGSLKAPVRLRNLSTTGAMLEGSTLPDPGVKLVLQRSDIRVGAIVVWRVQGRCGVRFDDASASVDEWVAGVRAPSFNGQQGQARVDAIQNAVRNGEALPVDAPVAASAGLSGAELEARIVEEIVYVRRLLDALGEEVADDPIVLQRHMQALQNLDRASQVLEHIGAILSAPDRLAAAEAVKMHELRTRLLRKPNFS